MMNNALLSTGELDSISVGRFTTTTTDAPRPPAMPRDHHRRSTVVMEFAPVRRFMGYACPVCGAEQLDGVHLANHLAVTASIGRTDHETWLEEQAPDWADCGPAELAAQVVEHADEIETPEFETPAFQRGEFERFESEDREHAHGPVDELATRKYSGDAGAADVRSVLETARELTERRWESDEGTGESADKAGKSDNGEEETIEETDDPAMNDRAEE